MGIVAWRGPEVQPAPDAVHVAYVKVVGERNFELSLLNLKTGEDRRLTWNDAFDGFPSFSPDGRLLSFSSSRGSQAGQRSMGLFLMDVSSLGLGPRKSAGRPARPATPAGLRCYLSITGVQVLSGLKRTIALAMLSVSGPRSFS